MVPVAVSVPEVRIATWNVNSLKARMPRVEEWIGLWEPDVLLLQETKLADDAFPALSFHAMGYESVHHGEGRWNGVAILSRVGLDDVRVGFGDPDPPDPEARLVWATCGGIRVGSVYVPNGRSLEDPHYLYKLDFLDRLRALLESSEDPGSDLVLGGDFNIAPDDRDLWDPEVFVGATHVSEAERERFRALVDWGLRDTFRDVYDSGGLFTWWDYRGGSFHRKMGMRIDHLLATAPLAARLTAILVDRNARKGKSPSDHAPLVADFAVG